MIRQLRSHLNMLMLGITKTNALRNFAQSLVDKANDDRTNAPKMINRSIALFDSAERCYDKGDVLTGKKQ